MTSLHSSHLMLSPDGLVPYIPTHCPHINFWTSADHPVPDVTHPVRVKGRGGRCIAPVRQLLSLVSARFPSATSSLAVFSPVAGNAAANRGVLQRGGEKSVPQRQFCRKTACSSSVQSWLVAVGSWRLATGGWWWLVVVGGSWWLVIGGW